MKHLISSLAAVMLCGALLTSVAYAQDYSTEVLFQVESEASPLIVNVSVPLNVSATMKLDGTVKVSGDVVIKNLDSEYPVELNGILVTGYDDWEIKNFNTDFSEYAVNSKALGMKLGDWVTEDGGSVKIDSAPTISPNAELALPLSMSMPLQNSESNLLEPRAIAKITYSISPVEIAAEGLAGSASSDPVEQDPVDILIEE